MHPPGDLLVSVSVGHGWRLVWLMATFALSQTFLLCSQEEWQLCFSQAPFLSQSVPRWETIHLHITSRGGRDALWAPGRYVCAAHSRNLSGLERVWGYVLAAKWEILLSLGLWDFLLGCKELKAEVPAPPFALFFPRQRRIHSLKTFSLFQTGAVNIPLLHNSPKSCGFFFSIAALGHYLLWS